MRWDSLFADLEAQLEAGDRHDFEAEVAERTRSERANVALADRLRAQVGRPVGCRLVDGETVRGPVVEAGADWILLATAGGHSLVPVSAVVTVEGALVGMIDSRGPLALRLSFSVILRRLARERAAVVVHATGGLRLRGVVDGVGSDHLDLGAAWNDESPGGRRGRLTVPYSALTRLVVTE